MKARAFVIMLTFVCAMTVRAQSVASTARGIVVAHDGTVELQGDRGWSANGVANPGPIVVGETRIAVFDTIANEAAIIDLADGKSTRVHTGESPIGGLFLGRDLFLLARDASILERFGADGSHASVKTAADPLAVRESGGVLYVYARVAGKLYAIDPARMTIVREADVPRFLSDLEVDAERIYLLDPQHAKLHIVTRAMQLDEARIGAVPTDLAIVHTADRQHEELAFADPSGKRVFVMSRPQTTAESAAKATTGSVGSASASPRRFTAFPTGVDRVLTRGLEIVAYDSATQTLYRYGKKVPLIATGVVPNAFALAPDGIVWYDAVRRLQKIAY
jgi:hypothetical protein